MITKEILKDIGKKKGLTNKEYIEKEYFQDLFLFYLFKKTNALVFKGGTALYKLYGLKRFSEDLDFSILNEVNCEEIVKSVADSLPNSEIKSIKKVKNSLLIKIGIKGILTSYNTLRIDINLKNPVLQNADIKTFISPFVDINPFSLKILTLEEIIAEKVHSIFNRQKARDLYDLFFLLRLINPNKDLIIKKLFVFGIQFDLNNFRKRILNLKTIWNSELNSFIFEELPEFEIIKEFVLEKMKTLFEK